METTEDTHTHTTFIPFIHTNIDHYYGIVCYYLNVKSVGQNCSNVTDVHNFVFNLFIIA